jgi:hypothetical protein
MAKIFAVLLFLFMIWIAQLFVRSCVRLRTAHRFVGTVVELVPSGDSDEHALYSPKIAYKMANGGSNEFQTKWASNSIAQKVGDSIDVFADSNGENPYIPSLFFPQLLYLFLFSAAFFAFGMCVLPLVTGVQY